MPSDVNTDFKKQFELELQFWNLTDLKYDYLSLPNSQKKMAQILEQEPEMLYDASTKGLNAWKSLKPLKIEDILS